MMHFVLDNFYFIEIAKTFNLKVCGLTANVNNYFKYYHKVCLKSALGRIQLCICKGLKHSSPWK